MFICPSCDVIWTLFPTVRRSAPKRRRCPDCPKRHKG